MSAPTAVRPHRRPLAQLGAFSYRRRRYVVVGWLVAAVAVLGLSGAFAGEFSADYAAHGSDSDKAQQLIEERFPTQAGQSLDILVRAGGDGVDDPAVQREVEGMLAEIATLPRVVGTVSPYESPDGISADGLTGRATVQLDVDFTEVMDVADTERILAVVDDTEREGLRVEIGGQPVVEAEAGGVPSEAVGVAAAVVILLVAFGTIVAAGLPVLVALLGLAIGTALIGLLALVVETPEWATALAGMMALGVGIDYVLLMVTRFREHMSHDLDPEHAVVATMESSGRAVLVAGTTVVISMLGLFATDLNYMQGAAVATIACVLVIMLAAVTLVPALLGFAGRNVDGLKLPFTHRTASGSPAWTTWSRGVQRRAWPSALAAVAVLVVLSVPFFDLRFGFPDSGNLPEDTRTREAYDLLVDGFGPGVANQLRVVADLGEQGQTGTLERIADRVEDLPNVAGLEGPVVNEAGDAAMLTVVPSTSSQDEATDELVNAVRDVVPQEADGSGDAVFVGGGTAFALDSTDDVVSTLPLLVGGVVGLSFVLLLVVFRSIAIAVKAAVLNALSIGAAYGVVAWFMQGGWAGGLIGVDVETPLPAFIPVLMFAILFGLSMDYEVFLVSRIREFWLQSGDASDAVTKGLAATARVITAAAAIMVAVFSAFVLSEDVFLKALGIGLATAVLVDATIIRMVLVPATMQILGRATWWLPGWLDRLLPQFHIEAPADAAELPDLPGQRRGGHDRARTRAR